MRNLLADWVTSAKPVLEKQGMSVRVNDSGLPKCVSVDLDGDRFVGGICHWRPNVFEFQFNSVTTGEVVVLETLELNSVDEISAHIDKLFESKLV